MSMRYITLAQQVQPSFTPLDYPVQWLVRTNEPFWAVRAALSTGGNFAHITNTFSILIRQLENHQNGQIYRINQYLTIFSWNLLEEKVNSAMV
jgi:hypothetical protein